MVNIFMKLIKKTILIISAVKKKLNKNVKLKYLK